MGARRNVSLPAVAALLVLMTTACGPDKGSEPPGGRNVGSASPDGQVGDGRGPESGYRSGAVPEPVGRSAQAGSRCGTARSSARC